MDDIFHNLIHEIYLPAVQCDVVQIFSKSILGSSHIQTYELTNKLTERLLAIFGFIILLGTDFAPQYILQNLYIRRCQRNIAFQLGNDFIILVLSYVEFGL